MHYIHNEVILDYHAHPDRYHARLRSSSSTIKVGRR